MTIKSYGRSLPNQAIQLNIRYEILYHDKPLVIPRVRIKTQHLLLSCRDCLNRRLYPWHTNATRQPVRGENKASYISTIKFITLYYNAVRISHVEELSAFKLFRR